LIYGVLDSNKVVINDTLFVNGNGQDSILSVNGGAVVETDVLINDGWHDWTPTLLWSTDPTTPTIDSTDYRYMWVNKTVFIHINIWGDNDTGGNLTLTSISLPVQVRDLNMYPILNDNIIPDLSSPSPVRCGTYVDANANAAGSRTIKFQNFVTITNGNSFAIGISGFYEYEIP